MRKEVGTHVARIESQSVWRALGTAPKWLPSAGETIFRQTEKELANIVVELLLELEAGPNYAFLEGDGFVGDEIRKKLVHLLRLLARILHGVLQVVWLGEVRVDCSRRLDEKDVKDLATPFDGVLDSVGEVLDGAGRRLFLGRVLRGCVRLGQEGDDDLVVTLRTQRPRFEQRFLEENAALIHVET